jgi:hypothetical protein
MEPGLRGAWGGRQKVLVVHPLDHQTGCVLSRTVAVPAGQKTRLHLLVAHDERGDFDLIVRADGKQLLRKPVNQQTATQGLWLEQDIDLSAFAGQKVKLELVNQPTGWSFEAAYWGEIELISDWP